ncbi:MAG: hypothetical protein EPN79_11660 [Burkholderiaceae bacterium]|nr:MAG: hypothetical protein EPN79_11660 [Burkholderiaceae bacterium]TBR76687.1 MAG: hypothetical protein EPN64_05405 [Burkholderiaceae bacterium]
MSYDARVTFEACIRDDVTREQVAAAVRPLLDYSGTELRVTEDPMASKMVALEGGLLIVSIDDAVGYSFQQEIFQPVVQAVGLLVSEPFEACLENQDTGDADERYMTLIGGPKGMIPEYLSKCTKEEIDGMLSRIVLPPGTGGISIDEMAHTNYVRLSTIASGSGDQEPVDRFVVNLDGLVLDEHKRGRIARLTALLAREIASEEHSINLASAVDQERPVDETAQYPMG